jgi:hypothetical protein
MRTALRTTLRLLGIAAMALLLSGCLKLDQALTLNEDDTVDGEIVFAVNRSFLDLAGISADEFLEQTTEGDSPVPEGVEFETEPYEDDEYIGSRFTFEGAPLSAFENGAADELSITREGDTFVVSGSLDASSEDLDPTGTPGAEEILDSFDVRISVTFPGEVEEATGEIDGNTVTWTPSLGETTEISARGSAIASGEIGNPALIWIVIGALVVLAVVVIAVVAGRKKGAPAVAEGAVADTGAAEGAIPAAPIETPAAPIEAPAAPETPAAPEAPVTPAPPPPAPVTEPVPAPAPTTDLPAPADQGSEAPPTDAADTGDVGDAGADGGSTGSD